MGVDQSTVLENTSLQALLVSYFNVKVTSNRRQPWYVGIGYVSNKVASFILLTQKTACSVLLPGHI